MSRDCMRELADRHGLDAAELTEEWDERAAIREYLAGFGRQAAELFAIGDVERMYRIGLHCPETRQRWTAGGDRIRPQRQAISAAPRTSADPVSNLKRRTT